MSERAGSSGATDRASWFLSQNPFSARQLLPQLKAGEYRLNVADSKLIIVVGKESVEVPIKVQNGETKFDSNSIRYTGTGDKVSIKEIRLGGTKTTLLFGEIGRAS